MLTETLYYCKEIEQVAGYEIKGGLYPSFDEAWEVYFGRPGDELRERLKDVHLGTYPGQALDLGELSYMGRRLLPPYHQAREEALKIAAGGGDTSNIKYVTSIYPCRGGNPFLGFFSDAFGIYDCKLLFEDNLSSRKIQQYSTPLNRLMWNGRQRLDVYRLPGDDERHSFESDVQFDLYGVPNGRIELYSSFLNPRGKIDLQVLYFPYNPYSEGNRLQERNGVILESVIEGNYVTTKVTADALAGFDGGKTDDREVLFYALTGPDGRTLVFNDLYPEFVWIEKDGGVPSVNGVDCPVLYLPKGWSVSPENLQRLGEAFADIGMTYEAYEKGTMNFEKWWNSRSVHARATTSDEGFWAFVTACGTGTLATIASEEEITRNVFGITTLVLGTYWVSGLRRYGDNYRNIVNERIARGNAFEQAVYKTLGRDDNNV